MKYAIAGVFLALTLLLGIQIFSSWNRQTEAAKKLEELNQKLQKAQLDQRALQSDLEYYSDPANLEKELRTRFNYRKSDEKMIIIVPKSETSSPSATPSTP